MTRRQQARDPDDRDQTRWTEDGKKTKEVTEKQPHWPPSTAWGMGCRWMGGWGLMNQTTLICYPSSDSRRQRPPRHPRGLRSIQTSLHQHRSTTDEAAGSGGSPGELGGSWGRGEDSAWTDATGMAEERAVTRAPRMHLSPHIKKRAHVVSAVLAVYSSIHFSLHFTFDFLISALKTN